MAKFLIVLLIALVLEAIGVVFISRGLKQVGDIERISASEILRVVRSGVTNSSVLTGVFFEALFFIGLLILMSRNDVSFIWPLTSLGFVITTLAAKFYLHEQVPSMRWAGVVLIVLGAGLISWTEQKQRGPAGVSHTQVAGGPAKGAAEGSR
jgi:drug/metabolite transporter (DMT)-like permease